ncbi:MAG: protein kinase [Planctomycetes bacterium]|nr:protein kinase [Planctomycetota bacterium]MBL7037918.1 protein kinase [Pirellulaceae bacterium]
MAEKTELQHPTEKELTAYARGELAEIEEKWIEDHILECSKCSEALDDVSNDSIVSLLRQSESPDADETDFWPPPQPEEVETHSTLHQDTSAPSKDPTQESSASRRVEGFDLPPELVDHPRYDVLEMLGKGGMGDVYKAEHRLMHRPVALKLISRELTRNQETVERFRREVQAAAQLSHPNIVTAHDADQVGDTHFLVMEYVDGINLSELLKKDGPLPIRDACDYVRQAALGLQHASEHEMVHRDIKPHNLMLTKDGEVKILDFGLTKLAGNAVMEDEETEAPLDTQEPHQLTGVGTVMGTVDYMAPEQGKDPHAADIRADIYSLGCTLYALVTGHAPFEDGSSRDRLAAHVEKQASPATQFREDVPAELDETLERMLAKDPSERYQTPAEVAEALSPFVSPAESGATSAAEAAPSRGGIGRWALAAVASLFVLVAAAIVIYVQTARGTIRVEIHDPEITVEVAGETITINNSGDQIRIKPGDHKLIVRRGDIEFESDTFVLKRGQNPAVRATFVDGRLACCLGDRLIGESATRQPWVVDIHGSLTGTVFHDRNGNGLRDSDESGLPKCTIELQRVVTIEKPLMTIPKPHRDFGVLERYGTALAFHDDRIFIADKNDVHRQGAVFMFDRLTGKLLRTMRSPETARRPNRFGNVHGNFGSCIVVLGRHVAVADYGPFMGTGCVHLFDGKTGQFVRSLPNPSPKEREWFGVSLAVVGDDLLVGEGHPTRPCTAETTAHLFDGSTGSLLRTFVRPSPGVDDRFGRSVAAMGNNVLIGAARDRTGPRGPGAVYMYDTETGELIQTFYNPSTDASFAQNSSNSIAALGDTVLVSAHLADTTAVEGGCVYAFDAATGKLLRTCVSPNPTVGERFGHCVVPIGDNILVGAPGSFETGLAKGAVYVIDGATGALLGTYLNPWPDYEGFGSSVVAMDDRVLIGAPEGKHGVYVFEGIPEPTSSLTNVEGGYEFKDQVAGKYLVRIVPPDGYIPFDEDNAGAQSPIIENDGAVIEIDFAVVAKQSEPVEPKPVDADGPSQPGQSP